MSDLAFPLTSHRVAELLHVPYRRLMQWVEDGLLEPDVQGCGRRAPRCWTRKQVREAKVLVILRKHGVSLRQIRSAMQFLRSLGHNPFSEGAFLVLGDPSTSGAVVKVVRDTREVLDLISRGQLLVPLWDSADLPKVYTDYSDVVRLCND